MAILSIKQTTKLKTELLKPLPQGFISFAELEQYFLSQIPEFNYHNVNLWNGENDNKMLFLAQIKKDIISLSDKSKTSDIIDNLAIQFKSHNLTLPKTNESIKIKDSIIAKIPFYTFVICWILAIAFLLK